MHENRIPSEALNQSRGRSVGI